MKSITWACITALILILTSGLTTAGGSASHHDEDPFMIDGRAESILGMVYSETGLEFQVMSYTCTEKSDFAILRLDPSSDIRTQFLLIRVIPDICDGYVPYGVKIFYSYEELDLEEGDRFSVLNPLSTYRVESYY